MKKNAFLDLAIVGLVFWGVWGLGVAGLLSGGNSVLAAMIAAIAVILIRKEKWRDFGIVMPPSFGWTLSRAGEFAFLIFVVGFSAFAIIAQLGYAPTKSAVLVNQPDEFPAFLLDLIIGGWLVAGIGEEFIFRGFLLAKFRAVFGGGRAALVIAVIAQALWFGFAHVSQGLGGMLAISVLAMFLGAFYLTRAQSILIPLMLGHAFVDTLSLTINYLNQ